ncbi:MAG: hypothetical protein AAF404_22235 [Pseudomonadota bacterium]
MAIVPALVESAVSTAFALFGSEWRLPPMTLLCQTPTTLYLLTRAGSHF